MKPTAAVARLNGSTLVANSSLSYRQLEELKLVYQTWGPGGGFVARSYPR